MLTFCGRQPLRRGERHNALVKQKTGFVTWGLLVSGDAQGGGREVLTWSKGLTFRTVSILVGREDVGVKVLQLLDTQG